MLEAPVIREIPAPRPRPHHNAVLRVAIVALMTVLAFLYVPVFRDLGRVWATDSYSSHGFLILLWSAWLAWGARGAVRAARGRLEPSGLALVAIGIALLAVGEAWSSLALSVLSLPVVLAGLGVFMFGWRAFRPVAFPVAFLALMTPLPQRLIPAVSLPLQHLAAWFTGGVLAAIGIPAAREGLVIRLDSAIMLISEGCNGLRFLLVMIVLGVGAAWAIERGPALALLVGGLAIVSAIAANLVRVASTVVLVNFFGIAASEGTFHSLCGKAIYLVALGLFLVAVWRLRRPAPPWITIVRHDDRDPRARARAALGDPGVAGCPDR